MILINKNEVILIHTKKDHEQWAIGWTELEGGTRRKNTWAIGPSSKTFKTKNGSTITLAQIRIHYEHPLTISHVWNSKSRLHPFPQLNVNRGRGQLTATHCNSTATKENLAQHPSERASQIWVSNEEDKGKKRGCDTKLNYCQNWSHLAYGYKNEGRRMTYQNWCVVDVESRWRLESIGFRRWKWSVRMINLSTGEL